MICIAPLYRIAVVAAALGPPQIITRTLGPKYTVKKGKTPVLTAEEAHALLESIPITKKPANDTVTADQPDLLGLRDRALIGMMVSSFARIGAVIQMKVGDYFVQGRRRWVRLHEKGGKERGLEIILSARPVSRHT